jgi:hypothetical protein
METYEVDIFFFLYSNILNNDNNVYNNEVEILLHHLIHIYNIPLQWIYIYTYIYMYVCRLLILSHTQKVVDILLISSYHLHVNRMQIEKIR